MIISGNQFTHIATIIPDKNQNGQIAEFQPQNRYDNKRGDPLNRHGTGSFCRFRISKLPNDEGVYAITINEETMYIGECVNLAQRFSSGGYGGISPKNCFKGGQPTNCKINKNVLNHAKHGDKIDLWFFTTELGNDRKTMESELIRLVKPDWNG